MANGRHREEPVRRPLSARLPQLPSALPRPSARTLVAAGVALALAGVVLGVNLWPRGSSSPDRPAALSDAQRYAALGAGSLQDAAALRADGRASRDRTRVTPATSTTTASPTASPSASPSASAKPAAPPKVTGKLWATSDVNVRSGPSVSTAKIGSLDAITQVGVTGVTKNGWSQVVVAGGKAGWVRSSFLVKSKPKPQASAPTGVSGAPCSISSSIEAHLTSNARGVYRAVCAAFGHTVSSFGGYRPGDPGDHGTGRAVDIMVSGDPGTQIARYVQAHASALHVTYVIYQQHIWLAGHPTSEWKLMEDRGSTTANHYDHVHVSVS